MILYMPLASCKKKTFERRYLSQMPEQNPDELVFLMTHVLLTGEQKPSPISVFSPHGLATHPFLFFPEGFGATIDTTLLYNHCFTYPNAFVYCGWYWFSGTSVPIPKDLGDRDLEVVQKKSFC